MSQVEENAETEIRHCDKHGDYEAKIAMLFGQRRIASGCPACSKEREDAEDAEEKRKAAKERKNRIRSLRRKSGIPRRFAEASFDAYEPPTANSAANLAMCRTYAQDFEDRSLAGASLVLCGKPGTGKTHLACAIGNHVIGEWGQSVIYTSVTKLARAIKATYAKEAELTEEDAIQQYVEPCLLIVDEVGAQRGSETELLLAQEIIDERYQQMRPTIVISNLPERELAGFIGERALDRMYEGGGAVLAFGWESYRRSQS